MKKISILITIALLMPIFAVKAETVESTTTSLETPKPILLRIEDKINSIDENVEERGVKIDERVEKFEDQVDTRLRNIEVKSPEKAEEIKQNLEDRVEAVKAKAENTKERLENKAEDRKEKLEEQSAKIQEKLESKDENRAKRALDLAKRAGRKLLAAVGRIEKLADRVSERLNILFEKGVVKEETKTEVEAKLSEAMIAIETAKEAALKVELSATEAIASSTPKEALKTTKEIAKESESAVREAHAKVVEAVKAIKASVSEEPAEEINNEDTNNQ